MAHPYRTRCDSKVSHVRLAGDWSKISYGLGRKISEAGWTFFWLADEIRATVFGFDGQKTVRRAVKRILANLKSGKFNSLEITGVASKRFLGLPYASGSAHSRPIQENAFLLRGKDHQQWDQAKLKAV